ncbi:MAG TPA: LD-carboxypeptidase [Dehalococcoidia bacterium]|nr:LD-carboxypeptidase [Dehalococcoidia bacterium]
MPDATAAASPHAFVRPRAVPPGGTIAVVLPASAVDAGQIEAGTASLQAAGFSVRLPADALARRGYLAGASDAAKAAALVAAFADPGVDAILCARGGYGSMRLLPLIDWETVRAHPKPLVGFSDVTGLHLALHREAGLISFHGPMPVWDLPDAEPAWNLAGLISALTSTQPLHRIAAPPGAAVPEALVPGIGEGVLEGGNLTLLAALCGTRWQPDLRGCIALIEDTHESPYRVDRMLTQLLLAGAFAGVRGVLVGDSPDCDRPPSPRGLTLREVLLDRLGGLGVPVLYGFPCGHTPYRATLPLGVRCRLDTAAGTLTLLDAACV